VIWFKTTVQNAEKNNIIVGLRSRFLLFGIAQFNVATTRFYALAGPAARAKTIQNNQVTITVDSQSNESLVRTLPFRNKEVAGSEESILKTTSNRGEPRSQFLRSGCEAGQGSKERINTRLVHDKGSGAFDKQMRRRSRGRQLAFGFAPILLVPASPDSNPRKGRRSSNGVAVQLRPRQFQGYAVNRTPDKRQN
jgi:hypothetical protein